MTVREYIENYSPVYRGHTPGHKGKVDKRDITEILDEFPADLVKKSEKDVGLIYGASYFRFLTGGSSMGIKAAVLALGEDFVTDSYCHRAVTEAAELAGVNCHMISASAEKDGLPSLTTAERLISKMRSCGARSAVVQYPDYYGRTPDLKRIYEAVKLEGGKLICDSAHGAHFALSPDLFPQSAVKLSDVCNMSAHKTLGAMTQAAFLAAAGRCDEVKLNHALDLLGTTSPSYVLLASLESAIADGIKMRGKYSRLKVFSDAFKNKYPCLKNNDFTRLVVDAGCGQGYTAAHALLKKGIAAEMYDDRYVVFILTPYDDDEKLAALWVGTGSVIKRNKT